MKIIKFYNQILELGSMSADKEGYVSGSLGGISEKRPVTIKGKRLVLPLNNQLKAPDWSERIVFHPLYENIIRGESVVMEKFRTLVTMRINFTIGVVSMSLLDLAASNAMHSKLNPEQSEFLAHVKDTDEKTVNNLTKILEEIPPDDSKNNFVSIFLKRAGVVAGKKYHRAGIVSFPLYQEFHKETIHGVKLRVKDRLVYRKLMEYIFFDIENEGSYNRGSSSSVAPFLDSFLRTVQAVVEPINTVVNLFKNVIPELEDLEFTADWAETLDMLDSLVGEIRSIPMQPGNEGEAALPAPATNAVAEPVATPKAISTTVPSQTTHPIYQQPVNHFQANPVNYGNHLGGYQNPPMVQQTPTVVRTKDGLDFAALLATSPAVAAAANAGVGMTGFQNGQFQNQQNIPRFALPNNGMGNGAGFQNSGFYNGNVIL